MGRLKNAIKTTRSRYLKHDYKKALHRMRKELKEYDFYTKEGVTINAKR